MAVSAASFVVPATSFVVSAAFAAVVTTALSMMSAALTAARQHLDELLDFFFGSFSFLDYLSLEVQGLACQWVVGVDGHAVILDLHYLGHKLMVFGIVHGDDGSLEDMLLVELAVDGEDITLQLMHSLRDIFPKGFIGLQGEIKLGALLLSHEVFLKGVEGDAVSGDELKGTVFARLFLQCLFSISHSVQLVCH